jgi:cell division protein FtsI (penicillin-binding protein 3)
VSRIAARPASHLLELHLQRWRGRVVAGLLLLWLLGLVVRAVYLQGIQHDFLQRKGNAVVSRVLELPAHRGMITDRRGEPLAISTPMESLWANPASVNASPDQLKHLSKLLNMPLADIQKRLGEDGKEFVYIKRQLPPEQAAAATQLGIPGLYLRREYRRYYPSAVVSSHRLGCTNVDDKGQEGMELTYQNWLAGVPGSRRVIKDRKGNIVEDVESIQSPKPGRDLALSIDMKIQYLAYRELQNVVATFKAKAAAIVVLDARTGEILALANLPSYNPNNRQGVKPWMMRNHAVTDEYEPGSTMKPFTVAAALDAGTIKPDTMIDTGDGSFVVGNKRIHDTHANGIISISQIIEKSSNVGAAKIALALKPEYFWDERHKAGFGTTPQVGFPGAASGKLRPYQSWRPIEQATMAFGNGIAVSLLQMARAYTVFANNGEMRPVTMLKQDVASDVGTQVFTPAAAHEVLAMMETVVSPLGTAPRAQVAGYRVAGKTGTAHKPVDGRYSSDKYIASFIGLAPVSNPRLIVAVMVDEPTTGGYYGGVVAAPVFSSVMSGALRVLDIPPDNPTGNVVLPPVSAKGEEESM